MSLESVPVVQNVQVDCMQRYGNSDRDEEGRNTPSNDVLLCPDGREMPYGYYKADKNTNSQKKQHTLCVFLPFSFEFVHFKLVTWLRNHTSFSPTDIYGQIKVVSIFMAAFFTVGLVGRHLRVIAM